jgi:apolipoprotein D and lipocalin family protein
MRRYGVGALMAVALAGCEPVDAPKPAATFRDPAANIGATTRFDPKRFAGDWHVVARFNETGESPARDVIAVTYDKEARQVVIVGARGAETYAYKTTAVLRPKMGEPLVVMWVDEGFRTAALGTPSGRVGYVLDRKPRPSADRFKAATQILKFYGWDISRLQRTK